MPFPILRTPFVVLSEIISVLEPNEIVTASFCSKNLKHLLKSHYQRRKPLEWRLYIDYSGYPKIEVAKSIDTSTRTIVLAAKRVSLLKGHTLKHTNGYIRKFSSQYPVLHFNDQIIGTKMIAEYVTQLFSLDIRVLIVDRDSTWITFWMNNVQEKPVDTFAWSKNPYTDHWDIAREIDFPFDRCLRFNRATDYFGFYDNVSENFQFNGKLGPIDQLVIKPNGHWVTLDNLMNFDLRQFYIERSRLSVPDLNSFLRHWRAGGSSRLTCLNLVFENARDVFGIFDEDLEVERTNEERRYRASVRDREIVLNGGYSIQRMDGVKATIHWNFRQFVIVVWHETAIN